MTKNYPPLSKIFQDTVYQVYSDSGDSTIGLRAVNNFLDQYGPYAEALIFKARMLIAAGDDKQALGILHASKMIDEWKVEYAFDEAEILFRQGEKIEATHILATAIEFLLREALEGVENFLVCIDLIGKTREHVFQLIQHEMMRFLSKESSSLQLENVLPILQAHLTIEEHNESHEVVET